MREKCVTSNIKRFRTFLNKAKIGNLRNLFANQYWLRSLINLEITKSSVKASSREYKELNDYQTFIHRDFVLELQNTRNLCAINIYIYVYIYFNTRIISRFVKLFKLHNKIGIGISYPNREREWGKWGEGKRQGKRIAVVGAG